LYYGWVIVAMGCVTMMLVQGAFFSSGVLFAALTVEYGWSRATTSLPFSVALIGYAATAWLAGRLFDRYGPRRLFPLGALCLGAGLIASAQAQAAWHLYVTWGLLVGQGANLAGFAPHLAHVAVWFRRQRGVAGGLVLSGASLGTLVMVPGAQYLTDHYGWRFAYTVIGLVVIGCLVPLNAVWQRHRPADLGLSPDGTAPPSRPMVGPVAPAANEGWTLRQALTTVRFWYLFVMVSVIGWMSNITSVHQIAHMVDHGFSSQLAAAAVGLMGLMRMIGSTVWGRLSDRFGREGIYTVGTGMCLCGLACLGLLSPTASLGVIYGYVLLYGLGYGVHGAVESTATADIFYGPHLGTLLGALELGWGLGGFSGAWFGGFWYDRWGSYHGAFLLTIGLSMLGCLALWLAAPRHGGQRLAPPLPSLGKQTRNDGVPTDPGADGTSQAG
jgi:MFS family permease